RVGILMGPSRTPLHPFALFIGHGRRPCPGGKKSLLVPCVRKVGFGEMLSRGKNLSASKAHEASEGQRRAWNGSIARSLRGIWRKPLLIPRDSAVVSAKEGRSKYNRSPGSKRSQCQIRAV